MRISDVKDGQYPEVLWLKQSPAQIRSPTGGNLRHLFPEINHYFIIQTGQGSVFSSINHLKKISQIKFSPQKEKATGNFNKRSFGKEVHGSGLPVLSL